jgi:hypothetical protein
MITRFNLVSAAVAAGLLIAVSAEAHHSFAMFDRNTEMVKSGAVVRWAFNNPHSWLYLNVKNPDGTQTLWSFESASPTGLIQRGITGDTFKPGANVTLMYCPLRDGRPGGAIGWARLEDGTYVSPADGGCNGNKENITRWEGLLKQGVTSQTHDLKESKAQ